MAYNSMRCPDSDEVRSVIVALLVLENPSYGIPVSKLENNYFNEETERIPFRDLGFTSLIDYLKSLNFIRVYMNNGKYYLDFLGTEKSRHVSELIKNQKRVSRHSSQSRRNISSSYFPTGQSQIISQNSHRSRNVHPSARLSSKVSKEILSGVNDHPRESNKHQVNKSRGSRPKLDRDSPIFNEYLNSIDNSVNMVKNNTVVDSAKNSSNSKRLRENFGASTSSVRSQSPFERENTVSVFFDDDPEAIVFEESEWEIFSSTDEPSLSKKQDNCGPLIKSAKSNQIRKNTQSQENSVLKEHNHQEKKIPTESTTTKIVANSKPQKESSEETKENDDEDDSGFFVDSRTKFRLEKLIQNHPDGIWCAELPKKYKNEYKISLDWSGDFDSVSQFASNLPEIFRCVRLDNHGDFKLYDAKQPNVDVKGDKKLKPASLASTYQIYRDPTEKPSALGTLSVPPSDVKHFQEPDVIYLGETVGQIRISEFDEDGREYEEVLVVEAFSPSFFWIQLRRKTDIFEDMMSRLEAFYKINKDQYKIPLVAFEQGLNVACLFYEKWHRGVIKNVIHHPELSAQILFYDYGTVKTYPISELYQLQRSFGHLPAQAIPCGLYNVKPLKGDEWPVSTSREFVGRVFNIPLIACVGKLDYDNNSMLISLTDTSKADDVHINDWLIDKGFAQSGNMDVIVDPNNMNLYVEKYDWTEDEQNEPQPSNSSSVSSSKTNSLPPTVNITQKNSHLEEEMISMKKEIEILKELINTRLSSQSCTICNSSEENSLSSQLSLNTEDLNSSQIRSHSLEEYFDRMSIQTNKDGLNNSVLCISKNAKEEKKRAECGNYKNNNTSEDGRNEISDRIRFENSISKVAAEFYERLMNSPQYINETNPFKRDMWIQDDIEKFTKIPPPIPPRTVKHSDKSNDVVNAKELLPIEGSTHSASKIIYEAPPVIYDTKKNVNSNNNEYSSTSGTSKDSSEIIKIPNVNPVKDNCCHNGIDNYNILSAPEIDGSMKREMSPTYRSTRTTKELKVGTLPISSYPRSEVKKIEPKISLDEEKQNKLKDALCNAIIALEESKNATLKFKKIILSKIVLYIFFLENTSWISIAHLYLLFPEALESFKKLDVTNNNDDKSYEQKIKILKRENNSELYDSIRELVASHGSVTEIPRINSMILISVEYARQILLESPKMLNPLEHDALGNAALNIIFIHQAYRYQRSDKM